MVFVSFEKTCKNCLYWERQDGAKGRCEKVEEYGSSKEYDCIVLEMLYPLQASVYTEENFGCIHFQPNLYTR